MTGCVDEGDPLAVLFGLIGADVLSDATGFAFDHVCVANAVEKCGLSVVDVTHDGDDRRAWLLSRFVDVVAVVEQRLKFHLFLLTRFDEKDLGTDVEREEFHLLVGESHGGRDHFAVLHEEANDVGSRAIQARRELLS